MSLTTSDLQGMIAAISVTIGENKDLLNKLDADLGDGDHGIGISIGFASSLEPIQQAKSPADVLRLTATTLMNRMGGSSGALFGTLFLRASLYVKDQDTLSPKTFASMLQAGKDGVMQRGKSEPGDKTMLDALAPAVDMLQENIGSGKSLYDALSAAAEAAEQGAQATANMQAKHGRAKYLGERAIGHIDAGAQSIALMFLAMSEYVEQNHEET